MKLTKLRLRGFRNYADQVLAPSDVLNVLWGANAQGKTNLLEAIYVLATTSSFRTTQSREMIAQDAAGNPAEAVVEAEVRGSAGLTRLELTLSGGAKRVRKDGKAVRSRRDWLGVLPTVVFSPEDLFLLKGPAERRRRTLDLAISSRSPAYFDHLRAFTKALTQRNALLKAERFGADEFEAWTEKFVSEAAAVVARRVAFLREIESGVAEAERAISGKSGQLSLHYAPSVDLTGADYDLDPDALRARYRDEVRKLESAERRRQMSLAGPQRDDFRAHLDGRDLAAYGSQGQLRTFAISFKLAEATVLARALRTEPLFLLDDVSSELDPERSGRLLDELLASPYQVFITTTQSDLVDPAKTHGWHRYRVEAGRVSDDTPLHPRG